MYSAPPTSRNTHPPIAWTPPCHAQPPQRPAMQSVTASWTICLRIAPPFVIEIDRENIQIRFVLQSQPCDPVGPTNSRINNIPISTPNRSRPPRPATSTPSVDYLPRPHDPPRFRKPPPLRTFFAVSIFTRNRATHSSSYASGRFQASQTQPLFFRTPRFAKSARKRPCNPMIPRTRENGGSAILRKPASAAPAVALCETTQNRRPLASP